MSASLVRKALDATTIFLSEEKLENLSKGSKKKFKPRKKTKKLDKDRVFKQNLKILKALDHKVGGTWKETTGKPSVALTAPAAETSGKPKKSRSKQKKGKQTDSIFTEEDFEKFEKEYFVQ